MTKWIFCLVALAAATASAAVPPSERDALIALYNSTGGASWTHRDGWLGAAGTECDWYGVECNNAQSAVAVLALYENNMTGSLPAAIGDLRSLEQAFFFDNRIGGVIPPEIGQLTNLEVFFLDRNPVGGSIPSSIGSLTKLRVFAIQGTNLSGALPREMGNLVALEELWLSVNSLSGEIPREFGQLTNVQIIDLTQNQLTGTIPRELGNLTKLTGLDLSLNQFTGTIPPELGRISSLQLIRLGYNQLTGTIPTELRTLRNLETLDLGYNQLTGGIPRELTELSSLKTLNLPENLLGGILPSELYQMSSLEEINIGRNTFTGPIPATIRNLTSLRVLGFWSNRFTGTIPVEITSLAKLQSLELQGNQFEGTIPDDIGQMSSLVYVDMAQNKLTGTIPPSVGNLAKLEVFSVYENQLDGPLPPQLGSATELTTLYLSANRFTGTLPETFRNLKKLQRLYVPGNQLTGSIPTWIGELTAMTDLILSVNQFSGSIPPGVGALAELVYLDIQENRLTGAIPSEIGNLKKLESLLLHYNLMTGTIPPGIWQMTSLRLLGFSDNSLTGTIPREIGNLTNLAGLGIQNNEFEGTLPAEIGNLTKLEYLNVWGNRLTGTIPREIGNLKILGFFDFSNNAFVGPIPAEFMSLTAVRDLQSDLSYNKLFTNDPAIRQFVNTKVYDADFEQTQTVVPTNVRVVSTTDRSAVVEWTPIRYSYDDGGYQVVASTTAGGAPVVIATSESKESTSIIVRNLAALTNYFFAVSSVTHPHFYQKNLLVSEAAPAVTAPTGPRVIAPADIDLTETTRGLVQIDGVPRNEDRFTLTNFGDVASNITVTQDGDFFTIAPTSFTLNGGASQTVIVKSLPKPPGTYYGSAFAVGDGTGDGIFVGEVLLSVAKPTGTVRAEAVDSRVEVAGAPGSDSVGQARFRNVGTAALAGIVLSDQPWVVPNPDPIRIDPGQVGVVNFRIVRSRRPPGSEGSLSANLSLVYVDGESAGALSPNISQAGTPSPGVSVAKVTVVDVSKPALSSGTIPPFGGSEVAYFLPGVTSFQRGGSSFVSDLSLLNNSGGRAISDVRMYFTPAGSQQTQVATLTSIPATQSVTLANVVTNVYGPATQSGSMQLRSSDWQNLVVQAKLLGLTSTGTFTGDVPVFRSDRGVPSGQPMYLAGLRKSTSSHTDMYVQEVGGAGATARIEFLDANGAALGEARTETLTPYGMLELLDVAPSNATTAVVTNQAGSSGRLAAYARVFDDTTGDSWSVVDWSRYQRFPLADAVRVAFVDGPTTATGPGGKRRAVPHAVGPRSTTELTLFNPTLVDVRATVEVFDNSGGKSEREVVIGGRRTVTLSDVGASVRSADAYAIVTPIRGQLAVTAHSSRTSVPIVSAANGLRVGQSQTFSSLDDSTSATVTAATPGTYRTRFGLVETGGEPAVVRARVFLDEGRSLASSAIYRDFPLAAGQQIVVEELVRAIVGATRDSALGDLHNLQLRIEVISGRGSVVPFVVIIDNATGDSLLRLE